MASRTKWIWLVLVVVGIVLALVSVFADQIGLGRTPNFGWKQTVGLIIGLVLVVVAWWRMRGTWSLVAAGGRPRVDPLPSWPRSITPLSCFEAVVGLSPRRQEHILAREHVLKPSAAGAEPCARRSRPSAQRQSNAVKLGGVAQGFAVPMSEPLETGRQRLIKDRHLAVQDQRRRGQGIAGRLRRWRGPQALGDRAIEHEDQPEVERGRSSWLHHDASCLAGDVPLDSGGLCA
jgi:hypothetical protein